MWAKWSLVSAYAAMSCGGAVGSAYRCMLAIAAWMRDLWSSSLKDVVAIRRLLEALGPGGMATNVRMAAVLVVAAKCLSCWEEIVIVSRLLASLAPRSAWERRVELTAFQ